MTTKVEKSVELAVGGTFEGLRPEHFRLERVADAVGWPQAGDSPEPDTFFDPVRRDSSND